MVRIAFQALDDYASKQRRNVHDVPPELLQAGSHDLELAINRLERSYGAWRNTLNQILRVEDETARDPLFARLFEGCYLPPEDFSYLKNGLQGFFKNLGEVLGIWFDERRYIEVEDAIDQAMTTEDL
jgi:hypothetical protein